MLHKNVMSEIDALLEHIERAGESGVVMVAWGGNVALGSVPDMSTFEKMREIVQAAERATENEALHLSSGEIQQWRAS